MLRVASVRRDPRRHGELTKFVLFRPIQKADKSSFAVPTGCRERGARRAAQGSSHRVAPVAPVARDACARICGGPGLSGTACPMPRPIRFKSMFRLVSYVGSL